MFTPTGTRRRGETCVRWNIRVPVQLAARFARLLENPAYRKTLFGSQSHVCSHLLEQYVSSIEAEIEATASTMIQENEAAA